MRCCAIVPAVLAAAGAGAEDHRDPRIEAVVLAYQAALNAADGEGAARLYSEDGVMMPPNRPSVVGQAAIRELYAAGARSLSLDVKFDIAEVVQVAPSWAFVRSNSSGSLKTRESGESRAETNQELFVLRKDGEGNWKIARYSFSSTAPGS